MWFLTGMIVGVAGLRGWQLYRSRHRIAEAFNRIDDLERAAIALRKITRVVKVQHAHKLAKRALDEMKSS